MTRIEFGKIMAYLEAGCGKTLPVESSEVYFDALGDLPVPVLQAAAKWALLKHIYSTFPPLAIIRERAIAIQRGQEMTSGEAWEIVMRCIGKYDVAYDDEHKAKILAPIPPLAMRAARAFGFMALYNLPAASLETARAQFRSIYDQIAAREQSMELLPPKLKDEIACLAEPAANAIAKIGKMPD